MAEQQIRIQVTADSAPAVAGLGQVDAALGRTSKQAGISAAQTAAAMRTLPAQFTDIATQLQGGASPLTVLLQQGGQIKDSFGGIGPALRGVGAAIGPLLTNPLTLAAGAALALGTAFEAGRRESVALANSLTLTGNSIGLTTSQINSMAVALDDVAGTRAGAAELLGTMVSEGGIAADMLQRVAAAATQLEKAGGPAATETAKAFAELGKAPLDAAVKLNERTNFLTASLYAQIRALMDQGRTADAARLAISSYADAIEQRTPKLEERLGSLERAWRAVKMGAAEAWDSMLNIGREDTLADKIAKAKAALDANARRTDRADSIGPNGRREGADAQRARLFGQLQALQQQQQFEEQAAQADLQRKRDTDKAIQTESAGHQAALSNLERAGLSQTLAVRQAGLDLATSLYANALEREQITAQEHAEAIRAIEVARIDAQLQNLGRLRDIEAKRSTGSPDEQLAKQAALAGIEAQRLTLQGRRVALLAQEIKDAKSGEGVNLFAGGDDSAEVIARVRASLNAQEDLRQRSEALRISMIQDDRTRGLAEIEAERQRIAEKLDLQALGDDARREAEDSLANYVLQRNEQLNEQLKPQWQRMVEGWADSTRLMREGWDSLTTTMLRESEDAFVQLVQTGKLNVKGLVNSMIAEFARLEFRKMVGEASGGGGLLGSLFSLIGAAAGGSGMDMSAPNVGPQLPLDLPGRANGGTVMPGRAYQVNERGMPELLQVGGRSFLMMGGQGGTVSAAGGATSGAAPVTVHQTISVAPGVDRAMVMAAMQQAKNAAVAAVADQVRRGNRAFVGT